MRNDGGFCCGGTVCVARCSRSTTARACSPSWKGSAAPGLRLLRLWRAPHDSLHPAEDRGPWHLSQGLAGAIPDAELRGRGSGDPQRPALLGNGGLERQPVRPEPDALERGSRLGPLCRRDPADPRAEQFAQRAFRGARPAEHLQLRARGNPPAAALHDRVADPEADRPGASDADVQPGLPEPSRTRDPAMDRRRQGSGKSPSS